MKIITILIFVVVGITTGNAQKTWSKKPIKVPAPICYASDKVEKSFVPPPPEFLNRLKSATEKKSEIIVKYSLLPEPAIQAFDYAVSIWEHVVQSPIPIRIQANWRTRDANILGSCGPEDYKTFEGAPRDNLYYPIALVEKLTKTEITGPGVPDMTATFNKDVKWYFGTDGNTPDSLYDFVSVVLHEIGHGLGITGFFFETSGGTGAYGYNEFGDAAVFDNLVIRGNGNQLLDSLVYPNQSSELIDAFTSGDLFANSPVAIADAGPYKPKLYAPAEWNDGSSIYHLNDASYPNGNVNSLMTHAVGKGEAVHDPGPITKGLIADIGWNYMYIIFKPVKDMEIVKPISFKVNIESEFEIDSTSLFVIYSFDSFQSHIDSLQLVPSEMPNEFLSELIVPDETKAIDYYINAGDKKNRTFTKPYRAPENLYTIKIGPDNEKPIIDHREIPYFLMAGQNLSINANVDDNQGVDSVYVEYAINNGNLNSFGMVLQSGTLYAGVFNFNFDQLNDGDIITYNVIAKDASTSQNTEKIPFKDKFSFKIEQIFSPITGFYTNFDFPASDFVISDFEIYHESAFENGALHSEHPYISSKNNEITWDFSTLLKHPIIIQENGTMSFDEVVLVEPSENSQTKFGDENFWDYVIIEGSKNTGKDWLPLIDGYDSRANITWRGNYELSIIDQLSTAVGIPDWFVNREINLLENGNFVVGDTILIRFRLFSDPFATGWGWAIDNLRVQFPVSSPIPILSPGNIFVYPNPFNTNINISIQAKNNIPEIEIDIYNSFGQKIHSIQNKNVFGDINEQIDLSNFSSGMYFISVKENKKQIYSKKIIKN